MVTITGNIKDPGVMRGLQAEHAGEFAAIDSKGNLLAVEASIREATATAKTRVASTNGFLPVIFEIPTPVRRTHTRRPTTSFRSR